MHIQKESRETFLLFCIECLFLYRKTFFPRLSVHNVYYSLVNDFAHLQARTKEFNGMDLDKEHQFCIL